MAHRITDTCDGCGACLRWCPTGAIRGEKKMRHVVQATLCIECGACGRVCPRGSVRDAFGIACHMRKRSQWEKPLVDADRCMSCGICIDACPASCLGFAADQGVGGHALAAFIDEKACIGCGFCSRECPVEAIVMKTPSGTGVKAEQ